MHRSITAVFWWLAYWTTTAIAYLESGATMSSCNSLMPTSLTQLPNQTESPYSVRVFDWLSRPTFDYIANDRRALRVQINGPRFKGFMLQARTLSGSGRRVGRFVPPLQPSTKLLECNRRWRKHTIPRRQRLRSATSVTHSDWSNKRHPYFFWQPPRYNVGPVIFIATIVATKENYWTNVVSPVLHEHEEKFEVDTNECGFGFGCIHAGELGCRRYGNCDYTIRWKCHGQSTLFDVISHKHRRFIQYPHIETPTDAFVGLSWTGNSVLCRYGIRENGSQIVTANNYFLPPALDEIWIDIKHRPHATRLLAARNGAFRCSFQRKNLIFEPSERVYFTYGTITRDGWIASIKRVSIRNSDLKDQVRLCKHQELVIILPKSAIRTHTRWHYMLMACILYFLMSSSIGY